MADLPLSSIRSLKALEQGSGKLFSSLLILRKVTAKTASNGNPFLSVDFGDRTGAFTCTVFSDNPAFELLKGLEEGAIVRVDGKIDHFQGRLSPRLTRATEVPENELPGDALESLVEVSPLDPKLLWTELEAITLSLRPPALAETVRRVFAEVGDAFRTAPAAISMHHAYRHGLLEHTARMARAAKALLPLYPEVDPDLALAGILLHDTGKVIEYVGALAPRRSRKGILQGHVVLGYQVARKAALEAALDPDRLERLEHIILSHQGELEWGAAAMAATPEAVFVSMVDNLDAKMGMVQQALRQTAPGEEFSEKLPGLKGPLLTRPLP